MFAVPHMLPYTASKFAAVGFSRGLYAELRGKGVRVTTVTPGMMRTGSIPQVKLVGDREAEQKWFSLAAETPVLACSAERAAKDCAGGDARAGGGLGDAELVCGCARGGHGAGADATGAEPRERVDPAEGEVAAESSVITAWNGLALVESGR